MRSARVARKGFDYESLIVNTVQWMHLRRELRFVSGSHVSMGIALTYNKSTFK